MTKPLAAPSGRPSKKNQRGTPNKGTRKEIAALRKVIFHKAIRGRMNLKKMRRRVTALKENPARSVSAIGSPVLLASRKIKSEFPRTKLEPRANAFFVMPSA
jgi:hypothetical protein